MFQSPNDAFDGKGKRPRTRDMGTAPKNDGIDKFLTVIYENQVFVLIGLGIAGLILAICLLFLESKVSGKEIGKAYSEIRQECQPYFAARVHHAIISEKRPLEEEELDEIFKETKAMTREECQTIADQLTMGQG